MAGDWIPVRIDIHQDPAVISIASELGMSSNEIVGMLVRFWGWFNSQSRDGHAARVTESFVDRDIGVTGFSAALRGVGWLAVENGGLTLPRFERWNSQSAKTRALARNRKAAERSRKGRDTCVTREEKRREENNPPPAPKGELASDVSRETKHLLEGGKMVEIAASTPTEALEQGLLALGCEFVDETPRKPTRRRSSRGAAQERETEAPKVRQPDPIWDAVAAIWFGGKVPSDKRSSVGRVVRGLKERDATVLEVQARLERYRERWPGMNDSMHAVFANWEKLSEDEHAAWRGRVEVAGNGQHAASGKANPGNRRTRPWEEVNEYGPGGKPLPEYDPNWVPYAERQRRAALQAVSETSPVTDGTVL